VTAEQGVQEGATNEGNCFGWAAKDSTGEMSPYTFTRRELRPDDVRMQVTYCGMCHSDVHQIRDEWGNSKFPMVPGHEVVGVIVEVGKDVKKFKVGDFAAVGCLVDSCGECDRCKIDEENYCLNGFTPTYNGKCEQSFIAFERV
jgi:D-arabinose 1-dehydrogenase-like Zn-dependent alcohol dehydrogenase